MCCFTASITHCAGIMAESTATIAAGRSGCCLASSNATCPPMLCPTTTGFSTRSCPQIHARSSANPAGVYSCCGLSLSPCPAEIDRDDAMVTTEVLELRSHVAVVTAPAVHQKHRRQPASRLLISQRYAVTDEFLFSYGKQHLSDSSKCTRSRKSFLVD